MIHNYLIISNCFDDFENNLNSNLSKLNIFTLLKVCNFFTITNNKHYADFILGFEDKLSNLFYNNYINKCLNNSSFFNNLNETQRKEYYSFNLLVLMEILGFDRNEIYWIHINNNKEESEKRYNLFLDMYDSIYESLIKEMLIVNNKNQSLDLITYFIKDSLNEFSFGFNVIHNHLKKQTYELIKDYKIIFSNYDITSAKEFLKNKDNLHYLEENKFLSYGCILNPDFINNLIKKQTLPIELLYYIKNSFSSLVFKKLSLIEDLDYQINNIETKNKIERELINTKIKEKK